jgi:D-arabinose 1-dehydrogenase-like Zn-dependent alcohol dehydrogenase
MSIITAMAASEAKGQLKPVKMDLGPLGDDQVEIAVDYCGICHSDLSMLNNDWGMSAFPLVPGHEAAGRIVAVGKNVKARSVGQSVGLGWFSQSCMSCSSCMGGDHNLCGTAEQTIVGRIGAFATRVRAHWAWATPLVEGLDPAKVGPMFCGGITVFNPIVQFGVKPTHRVGVVGIGGLGHMALQFLNKLGCEVTAFTSSEGKAREAKQLGGAQDGEQPERRGAGEDQEFAGLHSGDGEREHELAGVYRCAGSQGAAARGGRGFGADPGGGVPDDCGSEVAVGLAFGQPGVDGDDAGVRRETQGGADR